MSWTRVYALALRLLPASLRRKHGAAMAALFDRELERARMRGVLHLALAGVVGLWDIVRRSAYECVRARHLRQRGEIDSPSRAPVRSVPLLTTGEILRRHAASFVVAFVTLTASMLALYARRQIPGLSARGAPAGSIAETLLFSVPFLAAMTIPMAVLIAVLRELTRLGAEGALDLARRMRGGVRRLVVSLVAGAVAIAVLEFVVAAEIVPRANERLLSLIGAEHASANDSRASPRAMTIGALRAALRDERPTGALELERAARYEVEIQKKLALAAACVVMAVIGVAVALRAPRGGAPLVIGASCVVFGAYYVLLVTGEDLANRLIISPVVGMWAANALLLGVALLALAWRPTTLAPSGRGAAALGR